MRYNVVYRDDPASTAFIEASSAKDAATKFFLKMPTQDDRTIVVSAGGAVSKEFRTSQISPSPPGSKSSKVTESILGSFEGMFTSSASEVSSIPDKRNLPGSPPEPLTPSDGRFSNIAETIKRRYSDAFSEAHAVVTVGKTIKGVGGFLFIANLMGGFYLAFKGGEKSLQIALLGILSACLVGIPIYILGILVTAQGQTQLAALDTAVNSSRHLKDDDVAEILLKRFSL